MRKSVILSFTLLLILFSCNSSNNSNPQTDIETANVFIRNILDNKLDAAENYLYKDESNIQYFNRFREMWGRQSKTELENFKKAEIFINENNVVADSVTIINYSNSYKPEKKNALKLIYVNKKWLIDFKYTFSGNM